MQKAKGTEEDPNSIEGTGEVVLDRNDLLKSIMEQVNGKTD